MIPNPRSAAGIIPRIAICRLHVAALIACASVATLIIFADSANAQSAAPGTVVQLEGITIQGAPDLPGTSSAVPSTGDGNAGTGSLQPLTEAQLKLDAIPGGTAVIGPEDVKARANVTISDTIATVPGVIVQDFFGGNDQPRIQIRSAAQQNPLERGVLVLQDGLPINRADGSYIVGFADPRSSLFTEIYRGYTANRLGATVLGGAINFASHNGLTSPGAEGIIELGSFGQKSVFARAGGQTGNLDAHAALSFSDRDGFREENNTSERFNFNANVGARINANVSTRLFAGYTDLGFDVAGPLSKELLNEDPKQICTGPPNCRGPNVRRDRPRREAEQFRVGSRTSAKYGAHVFDLGIGYTFTDDSFRFPIPGGVRDTEGGDLTAVTRYAYAPDAARPLPLFEFTAQYVTGSADRDYFINDRGESGDRFGQNELDATTLSLHAGLNLPLWESGFTVSPAISYSYASRENKDLFGLQPRPILAFTPMGVVSVAPAPTIQDTSYDRSYSEWTPSFALSYELARNNTLFAAVSRSFEPPTHDDLIATINGNPNASPGFDTDPGTMGSQSGPAFSTPDLEAQTATTLEGGIKGQTGRWAYTAVAYYAWVENELLSLRDPSGVPLGAVNADDTTHFGVELGLAGQITNEISGRVAYTYQDFRFDNDLRFGDNRLAGVVTHNVNAAIRYNFTPQLFFEGEINWRPDETPVDNANTLFNDSFVTVDVRGNYDVTEQFSLYGEVRNVFDEVYASSTLIADTARPDQAAFLPGEGRAFIIGARGQF